MFGESTYSQENAMPSRRTLSYDADESRRRLHQWKHAHAGFVSEEKRGREVGKCSASIDADLAQRLLDGAIERSPKTWKKIYPKELFNVYEGVPYRAHSVTKGQYHGFPEKPGGVPPNLHDELRSRAQQAGFLDEFDAWMAKED
jgi:hypothetical protein